MYSLPLLAITLCWISIVSSLLTTPNRHSIRIHQPPFTDQQQQLEQQQQQKKKRNDLLPLFLFSKQRTAHVDNQETKTNNSTEHQNDRNDFQSTTSSSNHSKEAKTNVLRFGGKYSYTSRTLPIQQSPTHHTIFLNQFINNVTNQNVLLTGGKDQSCVESIPLLADSELYHTWKSNAMELGAHAPPPLPSLALVHDIDKDDEKNQQSIRAVKVTPPGIRIWTVEILPETIVGVQTILSASPPHSMIDARTPEIQAVLIHDFPRAKGPRPLVWLFHKIVHGTSSPDNGSSPTSSSSSPEEDTERKYKYSNYEKAFLRVWIEQQAIKAPGSSLSSFPTPSSHFVFRAESEMFLQFEFPPFLLKFFPISQQKAQEICSSAIVKALSMNLIPAIDRFADLYESAMEMELDNGNPEMQ